MAAYFLIASRSIWITKKSSYPCLERKNSCAAHKLNLLTVPWHIKFLKLIFLSPTPLLRCCVLRPQAIIIYITENPLWFAIFTILHIYLIGCHAPRLMRIFIEKSLGKRTFFILRFYWINVTWKISARPRRVTNSGFPRMLIHHRHPNARVQSARGTIFVNKNACVHILSATLGTRFNCNLNKMQFETCVLVLCVWVCVPYRFWKQIA